jgi:hypothetical protein
MVGLFIGRVPQNTTITQQCVWRQPTLGQVLLELSVLTELLSRRSMVYILRWSHMAATKRIVALAEVLRLHRGLPHGGAM